MATFGLMDAKTGEQCTNTVGITYWTTPCCYADVHDEDADKCPACDAPIKCEMETVEQAVCTIRDPDEDEE